MLRPALGQLTSRLYGPARLDKGKCVAYGGTGPQWSYDDLLSGRAVSKYGYDHSDKNRFTVESNAKYGTVWSFASGKCVLYAATPGDFPFSMQGTLNKGFTAASPSGDVEVPAGVYDPRKTWAEMIVSTPISQMAAPGSPGANQWGVTNPGGNQGAPGNQWGSPGAPGYPQGYPPPAPATDWGTYIGYGGLAVGALLLITSLAKK